MGNQQHKDKHSQKKHKHKHRQNQHQKLHADIPQEPKTSIALQNGQISHYGGIATIHKQQDILIQQYEVHEYEQHSLQHLLNMRMYLRHPHFSSLRHFQFVDSNKALPGLCTPQLKIVKLTFQYIPSDLYTLIKAYCAQKRPIQEVKVRKIFRQVAECLQYLKVNKTFHGDIKPATIGIKQKSVKLLDSCLLQQGRSAFQIVIEDSKAESFLTPNQLAVTKKRAYDNLADIHSSQVFCLGMSMIEAMTFEASLEAYNLENLELQPEFFQRKLSEMQEYEYSYELSDLALRCVHMNANSRPNFSDLIRLL